MECSARFLWAARANLYGATEYMNSTTEINSFSLRHGHRPGVGPAYHHHRDADRVQPGDVSDARDPHYRGQTQCALQCVVKAGRSVRASTQDLQCHGPSKSASEQAWAGRNILQDGASRSTTAIWTFTPGFADAAK
jgi:hypothetical protein